MSAGSRIVCYDAPTLVVKPVDDDGRVLRSAEIEPANFVRDSHGRLRSAGMLLPDEEFTITVEAEGCLSRSEGCVRSCWPS